MPRESTKTAKKATQAPEAQPKPARQKKVEPEKTTTKTAGTRTRRAKRERDPNRPVQPQNTYFMFTKEWKLNHPKEWEKMRKEKPVTEHAQEFKRLYAALSDKEMARLRKQYEVVKAKYDKEIAEYDAKQN